METESMTTDQAGAATTTAPAWLRPDRFDGWCDECQAVTAPDNTTDTRWCGICGTRRD